MKIDQQFGRLTDVLKEGDCMTTSARADGCRKNPTVTNITAPAPAVLPKHPLLAQDDGPD